MGCSQKLDFGECWGGVGTFGVGWGFLGWGYLGLPGATPDHRQSWKSLIILYIPSKNPSSASTVWGKGFLEVARFIIMITGPWGTTAVPFV